MAGTRKMLIGSCVAVAGATAAAAFVAAQGTANPDEARKRLDADRGRLEATQRRSKELQADVDKIGAERQRINGYMPNELQGELAYKVRPLNGVWATPPYLHNASVPSVYALLSPIEERPKKFYLGNREYDPVNLGYKTDYLKNGF